MAKAKAGLTSVGEYIARQPKEVQPLLARVRQAIRRALPDAEEVISYQIPAYKVHGRVALYFAGWKNHFALYPANDELVARFRRQLASYEVNDKGTIRFPLDEPVPAALIAGIAKFRAAQVSAIAQKKAGPANTRKRR